MVENYGKKAKKINITTVEINPNFFQRNNKINTSWGFNYNFI